jgi:ribonuclease HII
MDAIEGQAKLLAHPPALQWSKIMPPTTHEELALIAAGHPLVAGIDEAGRGCWAGPVVAAAVVLDAETLAEPQRLAGVDDSKTLSPARRSELFERITSCALAWGVGIVPAHVIDTHGILPATRAAMQIALLRLPLAPDALLIDAVELPGLSRVQRALIRGDARCLTIAAASIVAKVTRDRLMLALDARHPDYGFAAHKGYGTAAHGAALRAHGPIGEHRRSFRPISEYLSSGSWPTGERWRLHEG